MLRAGCWIKQDTMNFYHLFPVYLNTTGNNSGWPISYRMTHIAIKIPSLKRKNTSYFQRNTSPPTNMNHKLKVIRRKFDELRVRHLCLCTHKNMQVWVEKAWLNARCQEASRCRTGGDSEGSIPCRQVIQGRQHQKSNTEQGSVTPQKGLNI